MTKTSGMRACFIAIFDLTEFFWALAEDLERNGVRCSFIVTDGYWRDWLLERGAKPDQLLDLSRTPDAWRDERVQRRILDEIRRAEDLANVGLHEAMLMDSFARLRDEDEVRSYACMYWERIGAFLTEQGVTHVVCEPTNLTELVAFLCCVNLGIGYVVGRSARVPDDRLLFFGDPFEFAPLPLTLATAPRARDVIASAEATGLVPAYSLHPSTRTIATPGTVLASLRNRVSRLRRWNRGSLTYWPMSHRVRLLALQLVRALSLRRRRYHAPGPYRRRAIYPLHVQPEASIDVEASYHNEQLHLVKCFRQALPADCELLVKEHHNFLGQKPLSFFRALDRLPGVRSISHTTDMASLLDEIDLVFTVAGTVAYQAGLKGIPAVTLVPMFFSGLSTIRVCSDLLHLPSVVRDALRAERDVEQDERVVQRILDSSHGGSWGPPNAVGGALAPANVVSVAAALRDVFAGRDKVVRPRQPWEHD